MTTNIKPASPSFDIPAPPFSERFAAIFRGIVAAITDSRQRRAEREIAEILHRRGGAMRSFDNDYCKSERTTPFRALPAFAGRASRRG